MSYFQVTIVHCFQFAIAITREEKKKHSYAAKGTKNEQNERANE